MLLSSKNLEKSKNAIIDYLEEKGFKCNSLIEGDLYLKTLTIDILNTDYTISMFNGDCEACFGIKKNNKVVLDEIIDDIKNEYGISFSKFVEIQLDKIITSIQKEINVVIKKPHPLLGEFDFQGLCLNFAGGVGGFGALDDMDVLVDSFRMTKDGKIGEYDYASKQIIECEPKRATYKNYLADVLLFLYEDERKDKTEEYLNKAPFIRNSTIEEYVKYIEKYYGDKYVSDAQFINKAICQDIDFLMIAWMLVEYLEWTEDFKQYLASIY